MDYQIAFPTPDHIPHIADIWASGWHEAHAEIVPEDLLRLRSPESFVERARDTIAQTRIAVAGDNDVLGFCMIKDDELYQMYVPPRARGLGVAQALIGDAETQIRAAGHGTAWLACAVGNERAMRFYQKAGWTNEGRHTVDLDTSEGAFPLEVWRFEKALIAN